MEPTQLVSYIDAGSGSYVLAALAGGLASIWFYIRARVSRITGRGKSSQSTDAELENTAEDTPSMRQTEA